MAGAKPVRKKTKSGKDEPHYTRCTARYEDVKARSVQQENFTKSPAYVAWEASKQVFRLKQAEWKAMADDDPRAHQASADMEQARARMEEMASQLGN